MEPGFKIGDHCLQPNVALIVGEQPEDAGYCAGAPTLAIEVLSPCNTAATMDRNIELYLDNPVRNAVEVWALNEKRLRVAVYAVGGGVTTMVRHTGPFRSRVIDVEVDPAVLFRIR